ncbi:hypothetical protein JCM10908_002242 [Rhodotorula pacifica]|uniref:uncharacterized protein n=1 Tax=Rhodotorula pacifica TaxID=1495444 RepID=UPI00317EF641
MDDDGSLLFGLVIIVVGFLGGIVVSQRYDFGPHPPADLRSTDRYGNLKWIEGSTGRGGEAGATCFNNFYVHAVGLADFRAVGMRK